MQSNLSRRDFVKATVATAAGAVVGPMGLLSVPCFASSGIPTGKYLVPLSEHRFWFSKVGPGEEPPVPMGKPARPNSVSEDTQLSIRLGLAGGFALGFFSTLGFLGQYRTKETKSYLDLLLNSAALPSGPRREQLISKMLTSHRQFAPKFDEDTDDTNVGSKPTPVTRKAEKKTTDPTLAGITDERLHKAMKGIDWSPGPKREGAWKTMMAGIEKVPLWKEVNGIVQEEFDDQFLQVNDSFENRLKAVDTSRLLTFTDGTLKLGWIDSERLAAAYARGLEHGRLGGLAHHALLEANKRLSDSLKYTGVRAVNEGLLNYNQAQSLVDCFGAEEFADFGMTSAAFRPAIRLQATLFVSDKPNTTRRLDLATPFLPFTFDRQPTTEDQVSLMQANKEIAEKVLKNFSNLALSRYQLPATTVALPQGAFEGCAAIHRHTARLLRAAAVRKPDKLGDIKLVGIGFIPEVTSPWTFAGVAAALCNTYLTALHEKRLSTPQDRQTYRDKVDQAVDQLLLRSSATNAEGVVGSSASAAALMQYASGYRAARTFAGWVADNDAQAEGARKVYASLKAVLPEYFKDLPNNQYLTADQIATNVLIIGGEIRREIDQLRLKVAALEAQLKQYQQFLAQLTKLINDLQGEMSGVRDVEALKRFQGSGKQLIDKMRESANGAQQMALNSLQGLVNTVVQVGIDVDINVKASVKANAGSFNINK